MSEPINWYSFIETELRRHYRIGDEADYVQSWTTTGGYPALFEYLIRYSDTGILANLMELGRSGLLERWRTAGEEKPLLVLRRDPECGVIEGLEIEIGSCYRNYEHYSRLEDVVQQELRKIVGSGYGNEDEDEELEIRPAGRRRSGVSPGLGEVHISMLRWQEPEEGWADFSDLYVQEADGWTWRNLASPLDP